ncbi:hypothetical protein HanRHA438_Chr11g0482621 [Helianthus annuus]|nr:hypothetical protein HanRHA438_Chr11g0482621 [Helianthus annuus]
MSVNARNTPANKPNEHEWRLVRVRLLILKKEHTLKQTKISCLYLLVILINIFVFVR